MHRWYQPTGPLCSQMTLSKVLNWHGFLWGCSVDRTWATACRRGDQGALSLTKASLLNIVGPSLSLCVYVCAHGSDRLPLPTTLQPRYELQKRLSTPSAIFSRLKADRAQKSQVPGPNKAGKCSRELPKARNQSTVGDNEVENGSMHLALASIGENKESVRFACKGNNKLHPPGAARFTHPLIWFARANFFWGDERRQNALNPLYAHTHAATLKSLHLLLELKLEGIFLKNVWSQLQHQWIIWTKEKKKRIKWTGH